MQEEIVKPGKKKTKSKSKDKEIASLEKAADEFADILQSTPKTLKGKAGRESIVPSKLDMPNSRTNVSRESDKPSERSYNVSPITSPAKVMSPAPIKHHLAS